MALGSTQPLTEMSTRFISWGQRRPVRKADKLTPSCAVVLKSGNLNILEPSGFFQACNGTALPLLNAEWVKWMLERFSPPPLFTPPFAKICEVLTHEIKQEDSVTEVRFSA